MFQSLSVPFQVHLHICQQKDHFLRCPLIALIALIALIVPQAGPVCFLDRARTLPPKLPSGFIKHGWLENPS